MLRWDWPGFCRWSFIFSVLLQDWWRVLIALIALLFTLEEVMREVLDIRRSNRKLRLQKQWTERRIHDDLSCCHPMWPQVRGQRINFTQNLDRNTALRGLGPKRYRTSSGGTKGKEILKKKKSNVGAMTTRVTLILAPI